ncbi:MAG: DUF4386 domain-containing protein [Terracidiphilus sp.]|jgi:hypothetical protein
MESARRAGLFEKVLPASWARLTGTFYLLNFVTSPIAFYGVGSPWLIAVCGPAATASYVIVTALLYYLFRPVNRWISLFAACFSWAGSLYGYIDPAYQPFHINMLVFYGFYCLLITYLILRSSFMPHVIGAAMLLPAVSWLTFIWPSLEHLLSPYQYIAGGVGEGMLTIWLLTMGVNSSRWKVQANEQLVSAG